MSSRFSDLLGQARGLMRASIAESSAATYGIGWRAWSRFAESINCSPVPPATGCVEFEGHIISMAVAMAAGFCAHARSVLKLSAGSICSYLAGVAFHLRMLNADDSFLTSPALGMVRSGLRRLDAVDESGRERVTFGTLPVTLDMILFFGRFALGEGAEWRHVGNFVAMSLAFAYLLRRSEYIPSAVGHFLRASDIRFVLSSGAVIASDQAKAAHKVLLAETIVHIPSSKADQNGFGCSFVSSMTVPDTKRVAELLFDWAVRTHKRPSDPFLSHFSIDGRCLWKVDGDDLTRSLRAVATRFGFPASELHRFTLHSFRKGGASTLLAAGVSTAQVQLAGRWKSAAYMRYLIGAHSMFESTQAALANESLLTAQNVLAVANLHSV